ncbi:MAG: hypothetical protein AAGD34_16275, partial [Pseudomonadota bacterium]
MDIVNKPLFLLVGALAVLGLGLALIFYVQGTRQESAHQDRIAEERSARQAVEADLQTLRDTVQSTEDLAAEIAASEARIAALKESEEAANTQTEAALTRLDAAQGQLAELESRAQSL